MDTTPSVSQALLLTDDTELIRQLTRTLAGDGFEVCAAREVREAVDFVEGRRPALMFLDLDSAFSESGAFAGYDEPGAGCRLILLVSEASIPRLAGALKSGALTYLKKPVVDEEIGIALAHVRRVRTRAEPEDSLYGSSPQIQVIRKLVAQVAVSGTDVTVEGEPGVGKRVVGRLIHNQGPGRAAPFMQLGCAGFSEEVVLNLLFGSPEGSAAGSAGCLAQCRRGTLLIDDIDVLGPAVQEKLFRHLSAGDEPAAGHDAGRGQTRVIAVSSRSLSRQVRDGAFHRELFGILDRARIEIPPLRERKTDIPILADRFSRALREPSSKPWRGIEPRALAELMRYDWPGNVRELRDILEHAMETAAGGTLGVDDLPSLPEASGAGETGPHIPGSSIDEIEKDAILRTLEATGGSTGKAARMLQMSVRKIQYKLKEYRTDAASIAAAESRPALGSRKPLPARKNELVARAARRD